MWSRHVRAASMARNLYFLGTAGSGKSTMVYAFQLWMNSQGLDCVTVNLDPGAESLQYSPDLDVRDYVNLSEIMEEQDLGPNGAQVAAADMIAMNARELAEVLETFETSYILIATPKTLLDVEFLKSMESIGVYRRVHPVSSEITFGFDEIYNQVQQVFEGGEDLQKD